MATSGDERREMERLAAVRREVASCLETSIGALRTATGLLASAAPPVTVHTSAPLKAPTTRVSLEPPLEMIRAAPPFHGLARSRGLRPTLPSWSDRAPQAGARRPRVDGRADVCGIHVPEPAARQRDSGRSGTRRPGGVSAIGACPRTGGLRTASRGGRVRPAGARARRRTGTDRHRAPRLLDRFDARRRPAARKDAGGERNDHAARDERGRAADRRRAAISVLINNQPTRPLGATGQVVTHRITKANYRNLLEN